MASGSPELNESPVSADITCSFGEIGPQAPANYSSNPSNCGFATTVSASGSINRSKTNANNRILQTKPQTTLHRATVTGDVKIV